MTGGCLGFYLVITYNFGRKPGYCCPEDVLNYAHFFSFFSLFKVYLKFNYVLNKEMKLPCWIKTGLRLSVVKSIH